jgi:hypothetical protein
MAINFPPVRTRRLTVQLRELSIRDLCRLAAMPESMPNAQVSAFLKYAVESSSGIEDPADWTVQERTLMVAQYLSATLESGPDFPLSENNAAPARYSDYLQADKDYGDAVVPVGKAAGYSWSVRHLTGRLAESIERLVGELPEVNEFGHWLTGVMAAQLVSDEDKSDPDTDGALDEWLLERMNNLLSMPVSNMDALTIRWRSGFVRLEHLFNIDFSSTGGLVVLPKGGVTAKLPPCTFPVSTCLTEVASAMVGKPNPSGS